ncbi:ABC-type Fe3+/spermidine/putrescine transport system ATPase subunit [Streptomyces sp. B4I13]|nr:ABC-type Fe3+/spermidine/putrescine transport system ATPase subunit [Streptomyces sp. B4I13]
MASVTFEKATRCFPGMDHPAVCELDLEIADGECMVLVGPSGCGKSTSLRMLAGLEDVDSGSIRIGDRDVTHLPPKDRDIAMVFQNYALYPHMTSADNMEPNTRYVGDITYLPLHGGIREASLDAFRWLHRCNTRRRHSRRLACRSFVDRVAFGPPADFPPAASGCTGYGPTHARHSSPAAAGGPCLSHA